MLPPVCIKVLLHLQVGLTLCEIPYWASQELEGPWRLMPPFKDDHLNGHGQAGIQLSLPRASPWFPHGWWKCLIHPDLVYPTMIGWTIGGRLHCKSSARKLFEHYSGLRRQLNHNPKCQQECKRTCSWKWDWLVSMLVLWVRILYSLGTYMTSVFNIGRACLAVVVHPLSRES